MCGCDTHHKGPPGEGWKWGGCSEDAEFGVLVSREFADARENRPDARSAMNRHNNEAGRTVNTSTRPRCCCLLKVSLGPKHVGENWENLGLHMLNANSLPVQSQMFL